MAKPKKVPTPPSGSTTTTSPTPAPRPGANPQAYKAGGGEAGGVTQDAIAEFLNIIRQGGSYDPGDPLYGALPVTSHTAAMPGRAGRFGQRRAVVTTVAEAVAEIDRLDRVGVMRLQDQLLKAGFYQEGYYTSTPNPVMSGQVDDDTRLAFRRLLHQAILDPRRSLDQILSERIVLRNQTQANARPKAGDVGGGASYAINLSDPASIRKLALDVGVSVLGRAPTEDETARIVGLVHGAEGAEQRRGHAAAEAQRQALYAAGIAAAPGEAGPAGSIISPVAGGGSFSDTMHAPRSGGRKHKGTDIFGPKGTPAVAPVAGVVTKVSNSKLGGLAVWIRGEDGRYHYLAHLDSASVKRGQSVEQGSPIGTVGNSGNASATAPHVHYSINSTDTGEDAVGNPALEIGKGGPVDGTSTYVPAVTTTATRIDAEARAEEELRRANPVEAGAHDVADTFATFVQLIGGTA